MKDKKLIFITVCTKVERVNNMNQHTFAFNGYYNGSKVNRIVSNGINEFKVGGEYMLDCDSLSITDDKTGYLKRINRIKTL